MRRAAIPILIVLVSLVLIACGSRAGSGVKPGQPATPGSATSAEILLGKDKVPADVLRWAESETRKTEGAVRRSFDRWDGYIVNMGEKPTAGYHVSFDNAGFDGGKQWIVDVVFNSPGANDTVLQVMTYPYEVFAVPRGIPVKVRRLFPDGSVRDIRVR